MSESTERGSLFYAPTFRHKIRGHIAGVEVSAMFDALCDWEDRMIANSTDMATRLEAAAQAWRDFDQQALDDLLLGSDKGGEE